MAGRRPKPTSLKRLAGNPGHRPLNSSEPQFSRKLTCPTWLPKEAKAEWRRVAKELAALSLLQSVDRSALSAYAAAYARWKSAEAIVDAEGQTLKEPVLDKRGKLVGHKTKRHPATIIAKDERASMLRAAALFGFDPSNRSRLHVPDADKAVDPFAEFMSSLGAEDAEDEETNVQPEGA